MIMPFTVTEFRDLIRILHTQPEWRAELLRVLFPEALVDLPRALEALAEAQRQTEKTLKEVTERMERGFAEAAVDRQRIWENIERLTERMEQGFAEAAAQRAEAAMDRQRIWENIERLTERMEQGFAEAAAQRAEAAMDRQRIWESIERLTERMEQGFAEAAAQRAEAAMDRQRIWENIERLTECMEQGFAEAAAQRAEAAGDRKRIWEAMQQGFAEAAADRKRIWEAMQQGFAEAAADRKRIWEAMQQGFAEAAADRKRIWEAMQQGFAEAAADRKSIWEAMQQGFAEAAADRQVMRQDIGELKGFTREWFYHYRAASIFGRLLTAGQDATQEVAQQLRTAQQAGRVSAEEYQRVLDADLLWSGKLWDTGEEVILVLEASWRVHESDVERAAQRAEVLQRIGLKALPVTAGKEWPEQVEALALQEGVVITRDGRVDDASWQAALAGLP
jgi:uncharacterized LabA/DUF88 family protein